MEPYPFETKEWPLRYKAIAKNIPIHATILDLGGGKGLLKSYLRSPKEYIVVDKYPLNSSLIVLDFDKDALPDFNKVFDIVVCSGIIEYLQKPEDFLSNIKKYGDRLLVSYYHKGKKLEIWENCYDKATFEKMLSNAGWKIITREEFQVNHILYSCTKI